jgi:hypothetical protein
MSFFLYKLSVLITLSSVMVLAEFAGLKTEIVRIDQDTYQAISSS